MESNRTKILVGAGVAFGAVVLTWVVYQSFFKPAKKRRQSRSYEASPPAVLENTVTSNNTPQPLEQTENVETQISPPFEFGMKANHPPDEEELEANKSFEIMPGAENSFIEDESADLSGDGGEMVEEEIIAPQSVETALSAPPMVINLDDTVTLNSSDLCSGDDSHVGEDDTIPDDSDIIMLDDGDIAELLARKGENGGLGTTSKSTQDVGNDSDIIEVPIIPHNESPVECDPTVAMNESLPTTDLQNESLSSDKSTEHSKREVVEESVVQSDSVTQLNATLEEIEKNMAVHSEPCIVQEEMMQTESVPQQSTAPDVPAAMDDSRNSEDSMNGCESVTTDSGIVLSSNTPTIAGSMEMEELVRNESAKDEVVDGAVMSNGAQTKPVVNGADTKSDGESPTVPTENGSHAMSQTSSPTDPVKLLTKASTEPIEINTNQSSAGNDDAKNKTPPKDKKHVSPGANNNTKASPKPKLSPTTAVENGVAASGQQKKTVYKFLIPETLCGLFIGKSGRNISALKHETNTNIKIGREPVLSTFRYCTVEGNERNVQRALRVIQKRYPDVDTTSVDQLGIPGVAAGLTLSSDRMQLHLPMGVLIDVVVSNCVSAGHIFVQQPTHPTFNSWQRLDDCMNSCYGDGTTSPPLPANIDDSILCVAPMNGRWYRAQIMSFTDDRYQCEIKLMDIGGYASVQTDTLRQIREDFLSLPFQAVECYLANIEPLHGEAYSTEATEALVAMTSGQVVQCQPAAVAENNVPYIHVLSQRDHKAYVVNRELANQGLVKWYNMSE